MARTHSKTAFATLLFTTAMTLGLGGASAPALASSPAEAKAGQNLTVRGVLDPKQGLVGRWQREFDRREALLDRTKRRGVRGVPGLLGVMNELHGEVPDEALRQLLASVADDRGRDPLLRAHAGYLLGRVDEAAGKFDGARDRYRDGGWLLDWQIVGPFENTGRVGHEAAYDPETSAFDTEQVFTGKVAMEPIGWRVYPSEDSTRANVSFDEYVHPNTLATAYATTWIRVGGSDQKRDTKAALHVGTGGPYKMWIDGQLVGEGDAYRHPDPLQDVHAATLTPGWHRVLLKVSVDDGLWGFYLRLSDPRGSALRDVQVVDTPPDGWKPVSTPAETEAKHAVRSVRSVLESEAAKTKPNAEDLVALSELYRWTRPFAEDDTSAVAVARRADAAAQSPRSAYMLALLDTDQNDSRAALTEGIARARRELAKGEDPEARALLGQMLAELSWRYRSLGLDRRSRELLAEAGQAVPDDALIELARVDQLGGDGFSLAALDWIEDVLRRYPSSVVVRRELAGYLLEQGRTRDGVKVLDELSREQRGDATLLAARIDALLSLGNVDAAAELANRSAAASPSVPRLHAEVARLELARGDEKAAVAAMQQAISLAPLDADFYGALGELLTMSGDVEGGVAAFRRSLQIKPQQPDLRDLLATLDPKRKDDLFDRYGVETQDVVGKEVPDAWKGKEAALWEHRVAVRVLPNGLSERVDQRVIQVLDDRGVRSQSVQAMSYDPAESYVEVRRARVLRADGTVEDIGEPRIVSLAAAGYRMFYDQRQVQVAFPGLRVGDVVDVAFVKRDVAAHNMFDDYFGDLMPLAGYEPIAHLEYVLEAPAERKLYFNQKVERKVGGKGKAKLPEGVAVYQLERSDVEGLKPESGMPGWSEVAPYLHVSTYETWDDVAKWYWSLVEEQLVVDDKIRAGVAEAMSTVPEDAEEIDKVAAVYRHVVRNTRYVGLEFGIHGYKPYRTTDVYDRRFGDCKDKASLLKVMLGEIGVQAHLVLVRTRDQGRMGERPASLSSFNHAIVYVPKYDLFMDGTAEWSGAKELPEGDQGASVLVVKDGKGGTFRTIPFSKPQDNLRVAKMDVALAKDGSAKVDQSLEIHGADASTERARYESKDERIEKLTQSAGRQFPGTEVKSASFPGIGNILEPVRVQAVLEVPAWGQASQDRMRFPVAGNESRYVQSMAPQTRRTHPLELGHPRLDRQEMNYELPPGLEFTHIPESAKIEAPHGSFQLDVSVDGRTANVKTKLEIRAKRVSPDEYREFREFLRKVDKALGQAFEAGPQR